MKITFLGTAAAEGIPALWCECDLCRKAAELGGKDLRRRCCYEIDDDTLLDFGPDIFWQTQKFGVDLKKIDRVIFSHMHCDHLNPMEFEWRKSPCFSHVSRQLHVIGSPTIFQTILGQVGLDIHCYRAEELNFVPMETCNGRWLQDGSLEVFSVGANHAPGLQAQIHALRRNGRAVLIANDTGWLSDEAWSQLSGVRLDAAVIESTCSLNVPDLRSGHMGIRTTVAFREKLIELGCLSQDAPVYVNHFSHNGGGLHGDLEKAFAPFGMKIAFDGLSFEL